MSPPKDRDKQSLMLRARFLHLMTKHAWFGNRINGRVPSGRANHYTTAPLTWRGAHILCEYRLAPGAILHAGTERVGLRVRSSAGSRVLVSDVPARFAAELMPNVLLAFLWISLVKWRGGF